ncbi:hypothetical protein A11A3_15592 [Alcanivorax hongdengensis A-11-3]|uniref:Uncharacterized protein n=1 Tax=Alcanivorax hongdengensis A-11-3 TaxID=1177179 RepID=L0W8J8_9GAMM|nr:hypothetical protein [Alcanivorax hongdengensis]EKF73043.1 hypothetical protein A11A3_15592 [Alcanivorax hongdengensis A-11-3]
MKQNTLYVAFEAPATLSQAMDRFQAVITAEPETSHVKELAAIIDPFIDTAMKVFFRGPLDAAGHHGRGAALVFSAMKVIHRAATSLTGRLVKNTTVEEQHALAAYFETLRVYQGDAQWVVYPLDPAMAEKASLVFRAFTGSDEELPVVLEVMHAINDGAVTYFMDNITACLKLGRINRGLVAAARVTVCKAAASATDRGLPAMEADARRAVGDYFDNLIRHVTNEREHGSARRQSSQDGTHQHPDSG